MTHRHLFEGEEGEGEGGDAETASNETTRLLAAEEAGEEGMVVGNGNGNGNGHFEVAGGEGQGHGGEEEPEGGMRVLLRRVSKVSRLIDTYVCVRVQLWKVPFPLPSLPAFPPLTNTPTHPQTNNHIHPNKQISTSLSHLSPLYEEDDDDGDSDSDPHIDLGLWGSMAGLFLVAFIVSCFSELLVRTVPLWSPSLCVCLRV